MSYMRSFKAGEEMPSWLIDSEPNGADSQKPSIRFTCDSTVVEVDNRYWILPKEASGRSIVHVTEGRSSKLLAPGKTVILPIRYEVLSGPDDREPR